MLNFLCWHCASLTIRTSSIQLVSFELMCTFNHWNVHWFICLAAISLLKLCTPAIRTSSIQEVSFVSMCSFNYWLVNSFICHAAFFAEIVHTNNSHIINTGSKFVLMCALISDLSIGSFVMLHFLCWNCAHPQFTHHQYRR